MKLEHTGKIATMHVGIVLMKPIVSIPTGPVQQDVKQGTLGTYAKHVRFYMSLLENAVILIYIQTIVLNVNLLIT